VGVVPEGFHGVSGFTEPDMWFPLGANTLLDKQAGALSNDTHTAFGRLVIRLRPAVSMAAAESEARSLFGETAEVMGKRAKVSVKEGVGLPREQREQLVQTMVMLMAGVALVLTIACANVANLLLVRGASRLREVALRRSLGASDWRLARQLLTESVLLAAAAGVLGVTLALWGTSLFEGLKLDGSSPALPVVPIDGRVLGFAAALSILTAVLFALPPVLGTLRADPALMMRSGGHGATRRSRLQSLLVVAQVAVSFVLVVGAALFLRTVHNLRHIDLGFRPDRVLAASLDLRKQGYSDAAAHALVSRLMERLRSLPGTERVAIAALPPYGGMMLSTALPERVERAPALPYVAQNMVSPGYFATLGIPIKSGRDFSAEDIALSGQRRAPVAVVNEALAEKFWPGRSALGQHLVTGIGKHRTLTTVIGVVGNARVMSPRREQEPFYYVPSAPGEMVTIFVRSNRDVASLVRGIRQEVAAADPNVPLYDVMTLSERVDRSFADQIASAGLTGAFGIIGLVLAAIGLYAVIAFTVVQRTRELAIRVALGASEGRIRGSVVRDGVRLVVLGIAIGGGVAIGLARLVESRLFGVTGSDPATYVASAAGMIAVAVLATYLPARRAMQVDPMLALRAE
jgi:putative ABC transport system permease protein